VKACLNYHHHTPTDSFFLYQFDEQLNDKDDVVVEPNPQFQSFIRLLPARLIGPVEVSDSQLEHIITAAHGITWNR
jgi:DNA helicase IV